MAGGVAVVSRGRPAASLALRFLFIGVLFGGAAALAREGQGVCLMAEGARGGPCAQAAAAGKEAWPATAES